MSWGGRRTGAGRPRKIKSNIKPSHSIRASREEWAIIKSFAEIVKSSYTGYCQAEKYLDDLVTALDVRFSGVRDDDDITYRELVDAIKADIYGSDDDDII